MQLLTRRPSTVDKVSEQEIRFTLRRLARRFACEDSSVARTLARKLTQVVADASPLRSACARHRLNRFEVEWASRRLRELASALDAWAGSAEGDFTPALRAQAEEARRAHDALEALLLVAWAEP